MFDRRLLEYFDWVLPLFVGVISIIGLMAVYSASLSYGVETSYFKRQFIWFVIGLVVMLLVIMIDYRVIQRISALLHLLLIILLVLVLLRGTGGVGSNVHRWIKLGPFFLQPSEFVKLTLVLYLSYYFSDSRRIGGLGFKELIWPFLAGFVPFILIINQPDLGSASILLFVLFAVFFLVGMRVKTLFISAGLIFAGIPFIWGFFLKSYQRNRIETLINPEMDPLGKGYQIIQSKIAVGSGQLWGKGYMKGTQTYLNFLPARHTDFIFSVFSEEWGFAGSVTLLVLYVLFILWCLRGVARVRSRSGAILIMGVTAILSFQIVVNISMVIGLFPIVGMPLPFMSYGGSAMISNMIGIGLILNIRMRSYDL